MYIQPQHVCSCVYLFLLFLPYKAISFASLSPSYKQKSVLQTAVSPDSKTRYRLPSDVSKILGHCVERCHLALLSRIPVNPLFAYMHTCKLLLSFSWGVKCSFFLPPTCPQALFESQKFSLPPERPLLIMTHTLCNSSMFRVGDCVDSRIYKAVGPPPPASLRPVTSSLTAQQGPEERRSFASLVVSSGPILGVKISIARPSFAWIGHGGGCSAATPLWYPKMQWKDVPWVGNGPFHLGSRGSSHQAESTWPATQTQLPVSSLTGGTSAPHEL